MNIPQEIALAVHNKYPFKHDLYLKALRVLELDELRSTPHGWVCKSKSIERTEYCISSDGSQCGCKAGQHGILCSHRLALYLQLEMFRQTQATAMATGQAQLDVITIREQESKASRPARQIYTEELDDAEYGNMSYGEAKAQGVFE